jgi:hypothetical protein
MNQTGLRGAIGWVLFCLATAAQGQVTLAWDPTPGAVTNYTVFWGTNRGVYVFSNPAGSQTKLTVTGLTPGAVYYFTVDATAADGKESPFSNEIIYTNALDATTNVLPSPVGGGLAGSGATTTNTTTSIGNGGTSTGTSGASGSTPTTGSLGSTGSNGPTGSNVVSMTVDEFSIQGVPPVLNMTVTNGSRPLLGISGTVGATLMVQSSTDVMNPDSWTTITNLPITTAAGSSQTNSGTPTVLTAAFVPAAQVYEVVDTTPPSGEFYRVVMPYDYMVLADAVLSGAGYPSRLVLVRMPGVASDDVCYVTPQGSFLSYDAPNRAFAVQPSGSTIRQIATAFSGSLGQNWTSASEFAYSNGVSTILATVVETEPAASDPVAAAAAAKIQIDF